MNIIYVLDIKAKGWDVLAAAVVVAETIPEATEIIQNHVKRYFQYSMPEGTWSVIQARSIGAAWPGTAKGIHMVQTIDG